MLTPRFFGLSSPLSKSFVADRTEVVSDLGRSFWSNPVSYGVSLNVSAITSVAGWDVSQCEWNIAVSMISTPASALVVSHGGFT